MQLVDVIHIKLSHLESCKRVSQSKEVPIFGELINDHHNHILSVR